MDKASALGKIKKCLNLARSANEHEAASALRQAQKLMEMYRVSDVEIKAVGVGEAIGPSGASKKPAQWERMLAAAISRVFTCENIFQADYGRGYWKFIGVSANPEVAGYAFQVLAKQLRRSRAVFIRSECKRLVPASKTRRADLFCDSWVRAVSVKAQALTAQGGDTEAIAAYMLLTYPNLSKMTPNDRNASRNLREKDMDAIAAGSAAGRRAQLHRGVDGADNQKLLGS